MLDRFEVIGECDEARGLEWPPLYAECIDDRLEIRWCSQREPGMNGEEPHPLGRRLLRERDGRGVGERLQLRKVLVSRRRDREVGDRFHNAIEFESPKGGGVHILTTKVAARRSRSSRSNLICLLRVLRVCECLRGYK